ncbi:hypothetical protein M2451_000641 [Dysgonomonas sp. PFB1-18]|uniref:hypothetical protein n=1 Tax=unclassified Dysgonomonas TaxID=2630389 RepID=UPI002474285E|nr:MULTISPECIES: hypothetical protein [unclassified Dysgonomonas]MDH6307492.1 hypothetical protein [Dysgonomonas sp. PF1-14]MDH6337410.1 hypothetical protein [Dysgonomonas sp. PF1-16]MDH6379334.1 hypothetical protein [Dysgonomonas sp. PFB1-18]MDH6396028.1 hypothetical protein [Dysgonomonas sp. PF1-23]
MKKNTFLLFVLLCSVGIYSQNIPVSINGNYRTEAEDFGIGAQVMIPVYKGLMLTPNVTYFFEKEYNFNSSYINSNIKQKTLNYGLDIHYAFYLKNSRSFVSPFLGVEGMTGWSTISGSSMSFSQSSSGIGIDSKWSSYGGDLTDTTVLGNIGVAGKWFLDDRFFINTQVKYSLVFEDMDGNHFVFTAGIGYAF